MGDVLAGAGLFAATIAAGAAMIWAPSLRRSAAMVIGLALIPVLIGADQWNSPEISDLRADGTRFAFLILLAVVTVAALTLVFRRRPVLLPLALIAAIPFRVPIEAGGQDVNLLIPLYLAIAGGVLATVWTWWESNRDPSGAGGTAGGEPHLAQDTDVSEHGGAVRRGRTRDRAPSVTGPAAGRMTLLPKVLAVVLVLYAVQSVYSDDFSRALQNAIFFYVPFALAFTLLADRRWDRGLLVAAIAVVAAEALVFALFGFGEYATRDLIWNPEVIQSNDFHTYFRVNSLFWDPNIYGRYLALVITALVAALLWVRGQGTVLWLGALSLVLWLGLVTTFSQSSFAALLAALAALAALRWSLRWTLAACTGIALAAIAFLLAAGGSLKVDLSTEQTLNKDTGGRASLISEGIDLFGDRPLWGYGSGSFSVVYQEQRSGGSGQLTESHTEPVTVASEQGLIGLAAYLALIAVAFVTLCAGMRRSMPGLRGPPETGRPLTDDVARAAVLACFVGLIVHTMAYAGFLEDPVTWLLLAVGGALAAAPATAASTSESYEAEAADGDALR